MMQRCFIPPDQWSDTLLPLAATEQHHLLHVLRLPADTPILAFDGQGREAETRLCLPDAGGQAHLRIETLRKPSAAPPRPIWTLVPAIIKGTRMDSLIEKATELGAGRIMPIQTDRCVVRLDERQATAKVQRWNRIAVSAAKQCGTPYLPIIEPVTNLRAALQLLQARNIPVLLGALEGNPPPLARVAHDAIAGSHREMAILVGPEGDFTPAEYSQCAQAGCLPASFGPLTLRAETASIFALSVLQALWEARR